MRKLKFAFLIILVLCLTAALFVACNEPTTGTGGGTGPDGGTDITPPIPVTPDGEDPDDQGYETLTGLEAWNTLMDAAKASNSNVEPYVFNDYVVTFKYVKDAVTYTYAFKVQADIDLENDANTQFRFELCEASDVNGEVTLGDVLLGVYYFDSTVVYDCTGLKAGATVVKTDRMNMTAVVDTLRGLLDDNSLAQFLLNNILSSDEGVLGAITGILPNLFGSSRLITNEDGSQRLEMPIPLADIIGGALSGIFGGALDDVIGDALGGMTLNDIFGLVDDLTGIDLTYLQALSDMSLYLVAELTPDDGNGMRELSSAGLNVGLDFDTYGTDLADEIGIQQNHIEISIGGDGIQWNNDRPLLDVEGYLLAPEEEGGRGLGVVNEETGETTLDSLTEYSLVTVDLTLALNLKLNERDVTPNELLSAFGTLITGLLPEGSITDDIADILDKQIDISGLDRTLKLHIVGDINMFDNTQTNLLIELTGADSAEDVRASIGYVGEKESVYVDLSGLLGTGKFYVDGVDVNRILGNAFEYLVGTVQAALYDAGLTIEEEERVASFVSAAQEAVNEGKVVRAISANDEGEPQVDIIGMVQSILNCIDVEMNGNIFNIEKIQIALTEGVLQSIFALVFTGDMEGARIPLEDVSLTYENHGFASDKEIKLNLGLFTGMDELKEQFASLGVTITARFGSVADETYYNDRIATFVSEHESGEYIKLATLDDFVDLDIGKMFSGVESVQIGLQADLNIDVKGGDFADIKFEQANDFMVSVVAVS